MTMTNTTTIAARKEKAMVPILTKNQESKILPFSYVDVTMQVIKISQLPSNETVDQFFRNWLEVIRKIYCFNLEY